MNDKRSVFTDALETLGMLIDDSQKRDAIHLAVEPVIAGEILKPGEHIGLGEDGLAYGDVRKCKNKFLGIVDPFLSEKYVDVKQRFWMIIYPRQITSLRHVWVHPDLKENNNASSVKFYELKDTLLVGKDCNNSLVWLEDYAKSLGDYTATDLIQAASRFIDVGEYYLGKGKDDDFYYLDFNHVQTNNEFWKHFEIVTNQKISDDKKTNFFTCSC